MNSLQKNTFEQNLNADKISIQEVIKKYLSNWKWFFLSAIVFLTLAYLFIRYSTPRYSVAATIKMIEDTSSSPEMAIFKDLEGFSDNSIEVEDEVQIMKSRTLMLDVVKELKLNFQYFTEGRVKEVEMYDESPIRVKFLKSDSIINQAYFSFYIDIKSETKFNYSLNEEATTEEFTFGENIPTPIGNMVIVPTINNKNAQGTRIRTFISPASQIADYYAREISISPTVHGSNVLGLYLTDPSRGKAIDIINAVIRVYNIGSISERGLVAKKTSNFINERINLISRGLSEIDSNAVRFKSGNRLTNIQSEADIYLNASSANEQQLISAGTELNMVNYMRDYVENQDSHDLIPANVGFSDPTITDATTKYNELVLERQRLLKSSSEKNPIIVNLDEQLGGLRQTMQQSLSNVSNTLNIRVNNLKAQESRINSKIYTVPGKERELRDIQREQGIKEQLYLYLLQKREESAIASATVAPKVKIIDPAFTKTRVPVSPNPKIIYIAGLLFGFGLPFSVIYLKGLFDTKIHSKEDIGFAINNIPVLGEVPSIKSKKEGLIKENDRSVLAESFRILRTNLDYFIRAKSLNENTCKVIYVTSTIGGEGKSFVAENLALTLAYSNKKVLIIGADIRNPSFSGILKNKKINGFNGLTEYLLGKQQISQIIQPVLENGKLDIITSGEIPPNPAEILMNDKMALLFDEVKKGYDFIVVDTAPSMLVTDTLIISDFADHTIYVTRAGYTDKKILSFPQELRNGNKLKGMVMLINDVVATNFGYGNKYGKAYKNKK